MTYTDCSVGWVRVRVMVMITMGTSLIRHFQLKSVATVFLKTPSMHADLLISDKYYT